MTLILSNEDVEQLLSMPECIDVLKKAYVDLAEGRGITRQRSDCIAPTDYNDEAVYGLKSMDGVIPSLKVGSVRINSDIAINPLVGNTRRHVKIPAAPNKRYVGIVLLFSTTTGEPLAIFPDGVLQHIRVGATNGLGIKYLARKNSETVGILGSGWQAETQLAAACATRPIKSIRCFSPNAENRKNFAEKMTATLNVPVTAVDQPEDALRDADIIMCATNSIGPVVFKNSVRPGLHISSIKRPEVAPEVILGADRVAVHTHQTEPLLIVAKGAETRDAGKLEAWDTAKDVNFKGYPTIQDLITGKAQGRQSDTEVTCFLNNLGLGYQFTAAGYVIHKNAVAKGLGREIPTDWLTETVHP
jgi:ornithine cyclodeaminase/alanine dehydrogenase-like protein (mu-crystallin family)